MWLRRKIKAQSWKLITITCDHTNHIFGQNCHIRSLWCCHTQRLALLGAVQVHILYTTQLGSLCNVVWKWDPPTPHWCNILELEIGGFSDWLKNGLIFMLKQKSLIWDPPVFVTWILKRGNESGNGNESFFLTFRRSEATLAPFVRVRPSYENKTFLTKGVFLP